MNVFICFQANLYYYYYPVFSGIWEVAFLRYEVFVSKLHISKQIKVFSPLNAIFTWKSYLIMCLSCDVAEVVVTMGLRVFVNNIIRSTKCARITLTVKINCGFLNDFFLFTFRKKHTSICWWYCDKIKQLYE